MRLWFLLLAVMFMLIVSCSPQVKSISPPPYPPPGTPVTPATAAGSILGRVIVQGRMSHEGVAVIVKDVTSVVTPADGSYSLIGMVTPGQHQVTVSLPGFLGAQGYVEISTAGESITLPTVTLLAGDLNGDGAINLFDLVLLSAAFGNLDATSQRSDLNADGAVNLFDLVLIGKNLDRTGPIPLQ